MFSHGRGLGKLVLFYVLLLLVPGGYILIALAAIGVALGGSGGYRAPPSLFERERQKAEHNQRQAEFLAGKAELEAEIARKRRRKIS